MTIFRPFDLINGPGQFESGQAAKSITSVRVQGLIASLAGISGGAAPHTTSYTPIDNSDAGTVVEMNSASALVFTIPASPNVLYDVHTIMEIFRYGTGSVTIAAAGGVTLRSSTGTFTIRAQYGTVVIRHRSLDEWILTGDLT